MSSRVYTRAKLKAGWYSHPDFDLHITFLKTGTIQLMPLSPPQPRQHLHTRTIDLAGYYRDDGLWDIEAHIVEKKPIPMKTSGGVRWPRGCPCTICRYA